MFTKTFIRLLRASGLAACLAVMGCGPTSPSDEGPVTETRLHIRPSWSPDGTTIVFRNLADSPRGLYLVDTSGSRMRLLHAGDGIGTTWSPDSRWIAFSLLGQIYAITAQGDSLRRIVSLTQSLRPAWSPDGSKIAFTRNGVRLVSVQTGEEKDLFLLGDYPSWHPNGREVVAQESSVDVSSSNTIYRFQAIDVETLALRGLHAFSTRGDCGFSSISPGGGEILYSLKPVAGYTQVWKVVLAARQHIRLTDSGGDFPAWSPDGRQIVYTHTAEGEGGLWIMNADGSGKRRLTRP